MIKVLINYGKNEFYLTELILKNIIDNDKKHLIEVNYSPKSD